MMPKLCKKVIPWCSVTRDNALNMIVPIVFVSWNLFCLVEKENAHAISGGARLLMGPNNYSLGSQ